MWKIVGLIVGVIIVFYLVTAFGFYSLLHEKKWIMLAFFSAQSFLSNALMANSLPKRGNSFIQYFLILVGIRLLLCLLFVGFFLLSGVEKPELFVINFFVLYLCFSVFEIVTLYTNLRRFS